MSNTPTLDAAQIKERPILMHARSIRGILEGRKTQTRRIMKPQPPEKFDHHCWFDAPFYGFALDPELSQRWAKIKCPYGKPDDRLWVRETWQEYRENSAAQQEAIHKSIARIQRGESRDIVSEVLNWQFGGGERRVLYAADFGDWAYDVDSDLKPWRPSIFMPRWACRLVLKIISMRVERVQDISKEDAIAEGCQRAPIGQFRQLWDDTNGKGAWERNDWCWVIEFTRVRPG